MRKGVYLVLILLFPSLIYMLFSLGEHRVEKIRSFGHYSINHEGDTVYEAIPDVELILHDGTATSLSAWRGKPVVIDVVSFPCDEPCRKKGVTLVNYLNELNERDKWSVVSLALQPNLDPSELEALRQEHMPDMQNWVFASARDTAQLEALLHYVYVETNMVTESSELPAKEFVLIDQQGVLRAYFDSRIYKENRKLEDAVKLLLQEPFLTWKDNQGKK
jgi:cytochrome oxidase Cu insertion factor (SCO1/SenC/PrrC family)